MVRISCFVYIAPFFGTKNAPSQAKIGFSFFVALLVYGFVDKTAIEYTGLIGYAIIVLKEGITGLLIGFAANICNSIILFAGNIIDMDIGLSMVTEYAGNNYRKPVQLFYTSSFDCNRYASCDFTGCGRFFYRNPNQWSDL